MKYVLLATLAVLAFGVVSAAGGEAASPEATKTGPFTLYPIGCVRKTDDRTTIELDVKYQPGLLGLDGFSHVYVFWWFDRNDTPKKRSILQVHPRGKRQNPRTGVFATRAPFRPNLIALTLCKIVSIEENVVQVEKIDAFDGTPVLDLKPFIPGYDSAEATVPDWVGKR